MLTAIKSLLDVTSGVRKYEDVHSSQNALHVFASVSEWEQVDISSTDFEVTINGGVAMALYCEAAGDVLKIDTTKQDAGTTPALQAGTNAWEVTKVYKVGSTLVGNVFVVSW